MSSLLGIHVLGPRLGESIIVELPDGGVGVIDSFAGGEKTPHPVIAFLEQKYPKLSKLRFFALTHPHTDHCHRCAEICNRFPPDEVWVFRPFPLGQVQSYFTALQRLGTQDEVERASDLPAGTTVHSLLKFESQVGTLRRSGGRLRYLSAGHSFRLCGGAVTIHFLTPGMDGSTPTRPRLVIHCGGSRPMGKACPMRVNFPSRDTTWPAARF
jgi:hypothetical protein